MTGAGPGALQDSAELIGGSAERKVTAVADHLESYLRKYDAAHDNRAPFAYVYVSLTRRLASTLADGKPAFDDPDWVADVSVTLAQAYITAMDSIDDWLATTHPNQPVQPDDLPPSVPEPWRDVCAASSVPRSYVLEDVLFSMMAHISYDLPLTLLELASRSDIESRIADFHQMNAVLGSCIEAVQVGLADRYWHAMASLDHLFTQQDELLSNYGIRVSRGLAWYNFDRLRDPQSSAQAWSSIQRSAAGLIAEVRTPDDPKLRVALRIARWLVPSRRRWPTAEEDI